MTKENSNTKVITPEIICSYPYLFEVSDYTGKFGLSIPIPESDTSSIKKVKAAIKAAVVNKWGDKDVKNLGKKIASPLRNGNEEKGDDEVYQDTIFFSANSTRRPGVVNSALEPIMDIEEVYPGCIVRASVNFFAYDYKGKKGIAAGLQNVMKVRDGEQIGGKESAEDDFSDFAEETEEEAENVF